MARFDPDRPYNELPALPPKKDVESRAVLKACIAARTAVEGLRATAAQLPSQAVLINTLPLLEAQASSEIENIVTTADALFRYSQIEDQAADLATKEALRYRTALNEGFGSLARRPLSTRTAEQVCSRIKDREMTVRRVPGIKLTNQRTGAVVYTPPDGEARLRDKLANWERFIHDEQGIDPLIRMAVAHYQFEAIHPFTDGNGRTGRILNLLMLVEQKLLDLPVLYLSRAIIRNKADYYGHLLAVTKHERWEAWILYMLDAVRETAGWTTAKIKAIQRLQANAAAFLRARAPRIYTRELVEIIFTQPYCRIQNLVQADIAKRQTASVYLKALESLKMLREIKVGREKLFIHPAFVNLLKDDTNPVSDYGLARGRKEADAATN